MLKIAGRSALRSYLFACCGKYAECRAEHTGHLQKDCVLLSFQILAMVFGAWVTNAIFYGIMVRPVLLLFSAEIAADSLLHVWT